MLEKIINKGNSVGVTTEVYNNQLQFGIDITKKLGNLTLSMTYIIHFADLFVKINNKYIFCINESYEESYAFYIDDIHVKEKFLYESLHYSGLTEMADNLKNTFNKLQTVTEEEIIDFLYKNEKFKIITQNIKLFETLNEEEKEIFEKLKDK